LVQESLFRLVTQAIVVGIRMEGRNQGGILSRDGAKTRAYDDNEEPQSRSHLIFDAKATLVLFGNPSVVDYLKYDRVKRMRHQL
jgi:hypothetical protein